MQSIFRPVFVNQSYSNIEILKQYCRVNRIRFKPVSMEKGIFIKFGITKAQKPVFMRLIHACDNEHKGQFQLL